jgi:hypothetical protein
MYKKTIKYTDYDGVEREEDFFFNLSGSEIADMETSVDGGLTARINQITEANDTHAIINVLKDIIVKSYGIKSEDGRRFIKKPEYIEEFMQTPAFDELYMSLLMDEKELANFINKIIPAKFAEKAEQYVKENSTVTNIPSKT